MDREGDNYDLFAFLQAKSIRHVIRLAHNRNLVGTTEKLKDHALAARANALAILALVLERGARGRVLSPHFVVGRRGDARVEIGGAPGEVVVTRAVARIDGRALARDLERL